MPGSLPPRRQLLASTALVALAGGAAGRSITGRLPWAAGEAYPPPAMGAAGWRVLTADQAALVTAMADRLVPADENGPGAGQAGCALFLDRQLAGPFGDSSWLYMQGPFAEGTPQQGAQSALTPLPRYRAGLDAIAAHCQRQFQRPFAALDAAQQDALLSAMEAGRSGIADDRGFFEMLLANVMESYFADPAYGGNRDARRLAFGGLPRRPLRLSRRHRRAQPALWRAAGGHHAGRPGWSVPE